MKMSFYASACIYGIHGGGAYLVDDGFRFLCQKLIIEDEYKDLLIPYENIKSVYAERWGLFIPTTVIETKKGKKYRFLIFNRKKFIRCIEEAMRQAAEQSIGEKPV